MKALKIALIVAFAVFFAACSSTPKSPSEVASSFVRAVLNGEHSAAFGLFVPLSEFGDDTARTEATLKARMQGDARDAKDRGGLKELLILSKDVGNDFARVSVKVSFTDGSTEVLNIRLVAQNGHWRVAQL